MESFERESTAVVCIGTASDEKPAHSRPGSRGRECHHAIRSIRVTDLSISPVDLLASFFPPERMASLSLAMVEIAKSWYERTASAPLYYVAIYSRDFSPEFPPILNSKHAFRSE